MTKFRIASVVMLLAGPASSLSAQTASPYDSLTPVFAWVTDSVARLSGLSNLRADPARSISREIRMWAGFGVVVPHILFRLADSAGTLVSERIAWWSGGAEPDYTFDGTTAERVADLKAWQANAEHMRRWMQREYHCIAQLRGTHVEACRLQALPSGAADAVWRTVDSLNAWRLPDPSQLSPPPGLGLDGTSLMVEVRTPSGYRTYDYWEPDLSTWPEAKRASKLLALIFIIESRTCHVPHE